MKIQKLYIVLGCLTTLVLAGCQSMPTDNEAKPAPQKPQILSAESDMTLEHGGQNSYGLPSPLRPVP